MKICCDGCENKMLCRLVDVVKKGEGLLEEELSELGTLNSEFYFGDILRIECSKIKKDENLVVFGKTIDCQMI